jgi:response regulator RpfG family c-di-GMP phosphodiesterase
MTPDMAFDCLLVSRDTTALSTMARLLDNLSIHTNICVTASRAAELLPQRAIDLVVLDWNADEASKELMQSIWNRRTRWKTTIVAMSDQDRPIPGVHLVLRKPFTLESGAKLLRHAYSRMVRDFRRAARHSVMTSAIATDETNRTIPIIVLDIGQDGVGLRTKAREQLTVGRVLTFVLSLPNATKGIQVEARVLWSREHGVAGCTFLRIPPVDHDILRDWLSNKCKVKKPAIDVDRPVDRLELESC